MTAKDSNNRINLVATAVVKMENHLEYNFFLEIALLNTEFKVFISSPETTIFLDGHKGAISAIQEVLPNTP